MATGRAEPGVAASSDSDKYILLLLLVLLELRTEESNASKWKFTDSLGGKHN